MIFEINLVLLIKSFFYMLKSQDKKFKYLENEKNFQDEIKSLFHHFWRTIIEASKNIFRRWGSGFKKIKKGEKQIFILNWNGILP